jgi:hypothetical protein
MSKHLYTIRASPNRGASDDRSTWLQFDGKRPRLSDHEDHAVAHRVERTPVSSATVEQLPRFDRKLRTQPENAGPVPAVGRSSCSSARRPRTTRRVMAHGRHRRTFTSDCRPDGEISGRNDLELYGRNLLVHVPNDDRPIGTCRPTTRDRRELHRPAGVCYVCRYCPLLHQLSIAHQTHAHRSAC